MTTVLAAASTSMVDKQGWLGRLVASLVVWAIVLALLLSDAQLPRFHGTDNWRFDWRLRWQLARWGGQPAQYQALLQDLPSDTLRMQVEPELDDLAWQAAQRARTSAKIDEYLRSHPDGRHLAEAVAALASADNAAWELARTANTHTSLTHYLSLYPKGRHAAAAQAAADDAYWQTLRQRIDARDMEIGRLVRDPSSDMQVRSLRNGNDKDFHDYLSRYPHGHHAATVRNRRVEGAWKQVAGSEDMAVLRKFMAVYPSTQQAMRAAAQIEELERRQTSRAAALIPGDQAARRAVETEVALGLSVEDRRRLQVALAAQGFDPGGSDGVLGPRSRDMIGAWQKARGLSPTGYLDAAQSQRLLRESAAALEKLDAKQK